jgi:hypothetical protein
MKPSIENRTLRRFAPLLAFLILSCATAYGINTIYNASVENLREGLRGSCQRVNILRAQSNVTDVVSFRILSISGKREFELAKRASGNVQSLREESANLLFGQAAVLTITDLTDCERAIRDPDNYYHPTANPIGNPNTGNLTPVSERILRDSQNLLVHQTR